MKGQEVTPKTHSDIARPASAPVTRVGAAATARADEVTTSIGSPGVCAGNRKTLRL